MNFDYSCRHGISRTDFNLLSDPELSFLEVLSKMPSNPGSAPMNKGIVSEICDPVPSNCSCYGAGNKQWLSVSLNGSAIVFCSILVHFLTIRAKGSNSLIVFIVVTEFLCFY